MHDVMVSLALTHIMVFNSDFMTIDWHCDLMSLISFVCFNNILVFLVQLTWTRKSHLPV